MHGGTKTQARIKQDGDTDMHVERVGSIAQREGDFGALYH